MSMESGFSTKDISCNYEKLEGNFAWLELGIMSMESGFSTQDICLL